MGERVAREKEERGATVEKCWMLITFSARRVLRERMTPQVVKWLAGVCHVL